MVAAYATDPVKETTWIGGVRESVPLGEGALREGRRVARAASFMGRQFEYVNEVIRLDPGRSLLMRSVKAPFPMVIEYRFEDAGPAETRMTIYVRGGAEGLLAAITRPLIAAMVRRSITADLRRLRALLESSA